MATSRRKRDRFLKETSERDGFDNFDYRGKKKYTLFRDNGVKIAPTEIDVPPPSNKSLGGEGDISGDPRVDSDFTTDDAETIPPGSQRVVVSVNSSTAINWNQETLDSHCRLQCSSSNDCQSSDSRRPAGPAPWS